MPTPVISLNSPYHLLLKTEPNYLKLKIFGCLCFPWLRPYRSHKLETRSTQCVFLGYSLTQSAYLCFDPTSKRLYVSRHVRFVENIFPFLSLINSSSSPPTPIQSWFPPVTVVPTSTPPPSAPQSPQPTSSDPSPLPPSSSSPTPAQTETPSSPLNSAQETQTVTNQNTQAQSSLPNPETTNLNTQAQVDVSNPNPTNPAQLQTSLDSSPQTHNPQSSPTILDQTSPSPPQTTTQPNQHPMATRAKRGISKPNSKYAYAANLTQSHHFIPTTIAQALADPNWRQAVIDEFNSIVKNGTFSLVPPSPNQNPVSCRWIFTIKFNPDGSVRRYKARLVARGYTQLPGIDYTETFSPVIKSTTIRLVLDIAVSRSWPIKQLDVNNAFLQGTLSEEVYTVQPPGFVDADHPHHVCRLHKALYGLKQAPRAWYHELSNFLTQSGFINSLADTSLFILKKGTSLLYMLIYVDDIILTGNDNVLLQHTLDALATRFSVKEPEDLNYFLGIEAHRTSTGLHLTQRRYILDLLFRFKLLNAHPVATPMASHPKLSLNSCTRLTDATEYRSAVGSLQYLAFTRPDISYAVNKLS